MHKNNDDSPPQKSLFEQITNTNAKYDKILHSSFDQTIKEQERYSAYYKSVRTYLKTNRNKQYIAVLSRRAIAVEILNKATKETTPPKLESPPVNAEKLLYLLLPKDVRDPLIGDLIEGYNIDIKPKFGVKFANLWFWLQAILAITHICWNGFWKSIKTKYILRKTL